MATASLTAREIITVLCELYPKTFVLFEQRRRPLKIGIRQDLEGLADPKALALALKIYTVNAGYLRSVQPGAMRVDLEGNEVAAVTEADVMYARSALAGMKRAAAQKRKAPTPVEHEAPACAGPQPLAGEEHLLTEQLAVDPAVRETPAPRRDGLAALRAAAQRRSVEAAS